MQAIHVGDPASAVDSARADKDRSLVRITALMFERRAHAGLFAKVRRTIRAGASTASRLVFGRLRGTLKIFDILNNLT